MSNEDEFARLTANQRAYAEAVTSGGSQADAYRLAYPNQKMLPYQINTECQRLNNHPLVSRLIRKLQGEQAKKIDISREWVVRWHLLRASYDPAELIAFVHDCCRYCYGDGGEYQWRVPEYLQAVRNAEQSGDPLPEIAGGFGYDPRQPPLASCSMCHGRGIRREHIPDTSELSEAGRAAFEGIKVTKDGYEIKMADKGKAMENLSKLLGMDVQQIKLMADIPSDEARAAMGPVEIAAAYKKLMAAG